MTKKIGDTIIEEGITKIPNKKRETVRAIIIKNNQVLMLYSQVFNDYTFPGGGIKPNEDKKAALKRELKEEIGANEVIVNDEIGHTVEIRYGINGSDSVYEQVSYYFLCEASDFGKPQFVGREQEQGIISKWVGVDEAIHHNEQITRENREEWRGFKTVLLREKIMLKHIKENYLCDFSKK